MQQRFKFPFLAAFVAASILATACGDDDDDSYGSEAQRRGLGAGCAADDDCSEPGQVCLPFKGGYCGRRDCTADMDCPDGSACVAHDDGVNYCFLICTDKSQCNVTRSLEDEANCSSNITFVQTANASYKACVPPSG